MVRVFAFSLALIAIASAAYAQREITAPNVAPSTFDRARVTADDVDARRGVGETDLRGALPQRPDRESTRRGNLIGEVYDQTVRGDWIRRGEIVVVSINDDVAEAAEALGLGLMEKTGLSASGLTLTTWRAPTGANAGELARSLQQARPRDAVDLNHIYEFHPAARGGRAADTAPAASAGDGRPRIAAMIDSGAPEAGGGLEGVVLRPARFPSGEPRPSDHAQAVATVLAANAGRSGLTLLAADVSEDGPLDGAAATSIIMAADWAVAEGASVINISMTGPPSNALAAVLGVLARSGVTIVAAAGNDGPQAEAPYPAALPSVIGVTAVDDRLQVWRRATQGDHVEFAAPGVNVAAAGALWTGTSMAAPMVAGLILRDGAAREDLAARARDLGAPGRDPVYGYGFLSADSSELTSR